MNVKLTDNMNRFTQNKKKKKIVIWVEARKGMGHFRIASLLANSFKNDCSVFVVTSRIDTYNFFFSQGSNNLKIDKSNDLPIINASGEIDFIGLLQKEKPDAVILEMWPMRRAVYDDDIVKALIQLKANNEKAKVYSLVRDVYGELPTKPLSRHKIGADLIEKCVDAVLVRGDGQIQLSETWPEINSIRKKLHYVGYFGIPGERFIYQENTRTQDWIISMGGGWFDGVKELLDNVIKCHKLRSSEDSFCNLYVPEEIINANAFESTKNIRIKGLDSNYIEGLIAARISFIQAGYNSMIEALQTGTPAVFFSSRNSYTQGEQNYRIKRFLELGIIGGNSQWQVANSTSFLSLYEAIERVIKSNPKKANLEFNGANRAAEIICSNL